MGTKRREARSESDTRDYIGLRLPSKLLAELDRFAAKTADEVGTRITRTAAIEILIRSGLNARARKAA